MDQFRGLHHHHRDEDDEDEEEEGSEEMVMMNNNNNNMGTNPNNHIHNSTSSSSLNRVKMVEALSQVQIQPTTAITTTISSTPPSSSRPRYRECLRNHAINVMGHALDGCGEFMPGGPEGSVEALKCAACNCHRNFHRKEEVGEHHTTAVYSHSSQTHSHLHRTASHSPFGSYYRTSGNTTAAPSGYLHLGPPPHPRPLALPSPSGGGVVSHSRGEEDDVSNLDGHNGGMVVGISGMMMRNGKKRFRTKFAAEQKERMLAMAERIGWRIQKCDEELVQQFCNETGVKRHVFKVWMHNNKHTLGKISSNMNNNSSSSNNSGRQQEQQQQLM